MSEIFNFELDPYMRFLGFEAEVPALGQARVWGTLRREHLNSFVWLKRLAASRCRALRY